MYTYFSGTGKDSCDECQYKIAVNIKGAGDQSNIGLYSAENTRRFHHAVNQIKRPEIVRRVGH